MSGNSLKAEPMDQFRLYKRAVSALLLLITPILLSCGMNPLSTDSYRYDGYRGSLNLKDHTWLKGRKIFIDPGHGGKGTTDRFRTGPGGITEEMVNLRVSLILEMMLREAGAQVVMSRRTDSDVSLEERIALVEKSAPDILISIHHNGSARRSDEINYPAVLIWGNRFIRPASFDYARYLLDEFHNMMDERGRIVSDFAVFQETGTRILRKTASICPGVIGEACFFSDEKQALRLKDPQYNEREAESYFRSLSRYFRGGIPSALIHFSCTVENSGFLQNMIRDHHPDIFLKITGDADSAGIDTRYLDITLDDVPVAVKKCSDGCYRINYGKELYPGGHRLRFSFRNRNHNSSMVCSTGFTVEIKKGDYERLVKEGRRLVRTRRDVRRGLLMLLSALSMEQTGPEAPGLVKDIALGFRFMGLRAAAQYYEKSLNYFYPESDFVLTRRDEWVYKLNGYYHPVKYHGKILQPIGAGEDNCSLK